eukprot:366295-Chlamydomonas_euryale.AAC.5
MQPTFGHMTFPTQSRNSSKSISRADPPPCGAVAHLLHLNPLPQGGRPRTQGPSWNAARTLLRRCVPANPSTLPCLPCRSTMSAR